MAGLAVESRQLHVPPLQDVRDALLAALKQNFAEAEVEVVDCPDLSQEPFHLAAPGDIQTP